MGSTNDKAVIDSVKAEAARFVQRRGVVSDDDIAREAAATAERQVPIPRMRDGLLWKVLFWSSVACALGFGIAYSALGDTQAGFGGFIVYFLVVFVMLIVPSLMIASGAWGKRPRQAEAQRAEIREAWMLAANRHVILREQEERERAAAERRQQLLSRPSSPPDPQPFGVSPEGAERIVEAWMRHLGALDAEVTRYTGDGGIDVASPAWIAQVKHYQGVIGVAPIRELAGVAMVDGRRALFFTSTGYAAGASEFAERAGIGLFVYSAEAGTLTAANSIAEEIDKHGLVERDR